MAIQKETKSSAMTTLTMLLQQKSLALSLVVRGRTESLDEPVSWAHPCEYADPTPYLDGGELLMTTGLIMPDQYADEQHRNYVSRLSRAGVCGIGFGVGVHHATIPQWLVDQCIFSAMPLVQVPPQTPFIAIEKAISRAVADERSRDMEQRYRNQQSLIRSIHAVDPISAIVSRTGELIGGWAALLNLSGNIVESSHHFLPITIDMLGDVPTFTTVGEARFMSTHGYDVVVLQISSPNGTTMGYLMAGTKGELGTLDHSLVAHAASLLSLAISSSAEAQRILARLRSSMARRCLEGEYESVRPYAQDLWNGMPAEPVVVLRVIGDDEARESVQRLFEPWHRSVAKNLNPVVFGVIEGDVWAVISQSNAEEWAGQVTRDSRLIVGQSSGCTWRDLARGRHEAYQAAQQALAKGCSMITYGQEMEAGTLESLVEPSRMRAFADLRLAPITSLNFNLAVGPHAEHIDGDDEMTVSAVRVLSMWLEERCRFEQAARRLGVHRHTMAKYIGIIAKKLQVDLDDANVLSELWYACRYTRFQ